MLLGDFYKLATDLEINDKHPKMLCSRATCFCHYRKYEDTGVLPVPEDYGVWVGAPSMIKDSNLPLLNIDITHTQGLAEKKNS